MNARQARRLAWWMASRVVQGSLDAGWPVTMIDDGLAEYCGVALEKEDRRGEVHPTSDGNRLMGALAAVVEEMERKGRR